MNSNDDVTCIAMQRRLILCGTLYGSLLIFSADSGTDSNTSSKSVRTASNNSNINIINNNNNNNNNNNMLHVLMVLGKSWMETLVHAT